MQTPADPQRFVEALRAAGVGVPTGSAIRFTEALGILGAPGMPELFWAARTTLVASHEDLETFDAVFAAFFIGGEGGEHPSGEPSDSGGEPTAAETQADPVHRSTCSPMPMNAGWRGAAWSGWPIATLRDAHPRSWRSCTRQSGRCDSTRRSSHPAADGHQTAGSSTCGGRFVPPCDRAVKWWFRAAVIAP